MVSILDRCGPALTYVLHSKFGCTAVLHGVDAGAMKFKKPVFKQETVHSDSSDARKSVQPFIELCGAYHETLREARRWYLDSLYPASKNVITIHNNFIQHFGQREFEELLSLQTKREVSIKENFKDGRFGLTIQGASRGFKAAVLEVEALCCKVQEDFAKEELSLMGLQSPISSPRKPVDDNSSDYKERQQHFPGLQIVRVEKVENKALKQVFDLRKRQLQVSTPSQRMYQRLPVQFCDLLSRVGFQMEFTPPDEQHLGEGIYFSSSVHGAERLWKGSADQEYLYFIEAQVLTGKSIVGCPGLIVPPPFASDPLTLYDSVKGGGDTWVIFNGHQALPEYLITCNKPTYVKPHALFNWGKAEKPQKNEDIVIEGMEVDPAVFHVSSKLDHWIKDLNLKEPESSSSIAHDAVYQSESLRQRIHDMRIKDLNLKEPESSSIAHDAVYQSESLRQRIHDMRIKDLNLKEPESSSIAHDAVYQSKSLRHHIHDMRIKDLNLKEPESSSIAHDAVYQSKSLSHHIHDMRIKEILRKARDKKSFNRNITAPWQQQPGGQPQTFHPIHNSHLQQALERKQSHVEVSVRRKMFTFTRAANNTSTNSPQSRQIDKSAAQPIESLPRHWDAMPANTSCLSCLIQPGSPEHNAVLKLFRDTCHNKVIQIERIQNPTLWRSLQIKKHDMELRNGHQKNEKRLFHGTCHTTINHINNHGFNRSFAGKNATAFGNGTYFAVAASYSARSTYSRPDRQGQKYMYLCRVLTGDFTAGRHGMTVPPAKSTTTVELYNSVTDNPSGPSMFVIFHDNQAYPEYLITFF
ncbi:uncharacterized protein LOC135532113 [Oncorhynchus masou masou]|uniref:uncharacterized protein LOC135532113 n=1 Tax=Oncorhynchus masou masou TaxID=90313 RepID=UPI003182EFC8